MEIVIGLLNGRKQEINRELTNLKDKDKEFDLLEEVKQIDVTLKIIKPENFN